jgi:hypothetical protein
MKKLALILATMLIGMISMGQTVYEKKGDVSAYMDISENQTYWYSGTDATTITQADTLRSYTFGLDKTVDVLKQYVRIKLVENSGTAGVEVKLQGKHFWDESYTDILTATYTGDGADTTILFDGSTAKHYRFYKILLDGISDSTFNVTLNKAELQFYK